jgi:hypothetical protein
MAVGVLRASGQAEFDAEGCLFLASWAWTAPCGTPTASCPWWR